MEASGTRPPAEPAQPPPPPAAARVPDDRKAGAGLRLLAVLAALALAAGALLSGALAVVAMDSPQCDDAAGVRAAILEDGLDATCYNSSALKVGTIALAWPATALLAVAAILALAFAATGRRGQLLVRLAVAGVVLGGVAYLLAAID
jgi:hypothetical protein